MVFILFHRNAYGGIVKPWDFTTMLAGINATTVPQINRKESTTNCVRAVPVAKPKLQSLSRMEKNVQSRSKVAQHMVTLRFLKVRGKQLQRRYQNLKRVAKAYQLLWSVSGMVTH